MQSYRLKTTKFFSLVTKGKAHKISAFQKSNERVNRLSGPINRYVLTAVTTQTCATLHNTTQYNRNNNSAAYPEPRSHLRKKRTKNTALEHKHKYICPLLCNASWYYPRLLQCTMVTTCTSCFNIKETAVYPQSVVRFYITLRTNTNCVHSN